ncbi:hypothetical protein BJ138DRAFT_1197670 [Hygrophoropsis aurantiaca]|uniref:Uncharacterized protein n=1 Tax=Hygrophoropsis aurantiaca TaxID=72124 RepID=A0ACB8A7W2_9AGAM|nr:hypothetical protein BJ138DRAFT_1197670 [Hygrophoropsis aurantiaca]
MDTETIERLGRWKLQRFSKEIPFTKAVTSLATDKPLVYLEADNQYRTRWTFYDTKTKRPAVFCHAAVWAWSSDLATGNYVPENKPAPLGLPATRLRTKPSTQCQVTYCFNTEYDESLFDIQQTLEEWLPSVKNFNATARPRRGWQDGTDPSRRNRFIMTWDIFERKGKDNTEWVSRIKYDPHPWVKDAVEKHTYVVPTITKPSFFRLEDKVLTAISDTNPDTFHRGDIVWVSFVLKYDVSGQWSPVYMPVDFVRVHTTASDEIDNTNNQRASPTGDVPRLEAGLVQLPDTEDEVQLAESEDTHSAGDHTQQLEDGGESSSTKEDTVASGSGPTRTTRKRKAEQGIESEETLSDLEDVHPPVASKKRTIKKKAV